MIITYGIVRRLLILATALTITANAAPADWRCPQQCQCSNEGRDLTVLCSDILLDHFPSDIPKSVKSLDISSNSISNMSEKDLKRFPLLKYLDISSNNIQDITSDTFFALTLLEKLDLSYNKIISFNTNTFIHNRILTHLSIVGNPLRAVDDSPVVTSDSLKTLELDLGTWSKHTFESLTSLERLIVHWKDGFNMSITTFEPIYTLREMNIICKKECDELSPGLKNYFTKSGVKLVYNRTAIKKMVTMKGYDSNEEDEHKQDIKTPSSPLQGADEVQNETLHISEDVAEITSSDEEKVYHQDNSTLTSSTHQPFAKIEIESIKNKFTSRDSSTIPESFVKGREVDKEQAPENTENKLQILGNKNILFAASGVIVALMILILVLGLFVTVRCLCRSLARTSHYGHIKEKQSNIQFYKTPAPQLEHVYDEVKDIDNRLFYHIYYDHDAPLLPQRPQLRPPVPPRPVGYYSVAYGTEIK